jgi:hypothetical protein
MLANAAALSSRTILTHELVRTGVPTLQNVPVAAQMKRLVKWPVMAQLGRRAQFLAEAFLDSFQTLHVFGSAWGNARRICQFYFENF